MHLEYFPGIEAIADAKAEIFSGVEPGGAAVINRDNPQFAQPAPTASSAALRASSRSAPMTKPMPGYCDIRCMPTARPCMRTSSAMTSPTSSACPAGIMAINSLAVLAAASLAGADLALAALALSQIEPAAGRGARARCELAGGERRP